MKQLVCVLAASLLALTAPAWCASLPKAAKPEDVGFSSQRLQYLTDKLNAEVAGGKIPGAVVLIARDGKIAYQQTFGFQDRAANTSMQAD